MTDFRKYLIIGFYLLSVAILIYAAINNTIGDPQNINSSREIEGRKITFSGYWSDKKITTDMVKSGAIPEDKLVHGNEAWIANVDIESQKGNYRIKVGVSDFQLIDSNSKKYNPVVDTQSEFLLKEGEKAELQLVFLIPPETKVQKILYTLRDNTKKKLLIDLD